MSAFNFDGYKFSTWLKKNKDNLRLILAGTLGIVAAAVSGLDPKWSVPLGAIVTAGSKLAIDAIDYWASE